MNKNIITYLKTKKNLSEEIKNMTIEEKIKEIGEVCKLLKEIPNDIDSDLLAMKMEILETVYYEAKASGVPKDTLKKIEELIDTEKKNIKEAKKQQEKDMKELAELFEGKASRVQKKTLKKTEKLIEELIHTEKKEIKRQEKQQKKR